MRKANTNVNIEDLQQKTKEFIHRLEKKLGRELIITSGYRSPDHPIEKAKKKPGEHSFGLAVDVYCYLPTEFLEVTGEAYRLGCRRIGVSRKGHFIQLGYLMNFLPLFGPIRPHWMRVVCILMSYLFFGM